MLCLRTEVWFFFLHASGIQLDKNPSCLLPPVYRSLRRVSHLHCKDTFAWKGSTCAASRQPAEDPVPVWGICYGMRWEWTCVTPRTVRCSFPLKGSACIYFERWFTAHLALPCLWLMTQVLPKKYSLKKFKASPGICWNSTQWCVLTTVRATLTHCTRGELSQEQHLFKN